jgi:ADP-ribose pyrophosphatase YjhB (NUDIX family)
MATKTHIGGVVCLVAGYALYSAYHRRVIHALQEELRQKEKVQGSFQHILNKNLKDDHYQNCIIDLTGSPDKITGDLTSFKEGIDQLVKREKSTSKHMVVFKISPQQSSLYEPLIQSGFAGHQANRKFTVLTKCLSDHSPDTCNYPKYRPILIGVTAVVFDQTLEKVLLIQEKQGPAKGKWKPPTGTVEYETGENPTQAVVREVEEETGIQLKQEDARLTSCYFANNYAIPDHNFTYVFVIPDIVPLKAQEGEISGIRWHSVDKFLSQTDEKPWIMRTSVQAAFAALKKQTEWKPSINYFSSGKPATVLSNL